MTSRRRRIPSRRNLCFRRHLGCVASMNLYARKIEVHWLGAAIA